MQRKSGVLAPGDSRGWRQGEVEALRTVSAQVHGFENAAKDDLLSMRTQGGIQSQMCPTGCHSVPQLRWSPASRVALARHSRFIP